MARFLAALEYGFNRILDKAHGRSAMHNRGATPSKLVHPILGWLLVGPATRQTGIVRGK